MIRRPDLSPGQIKTALDVLTGLVVISVGVALAGLTWRIAGHAGTGAVTVPSGSSAPALVPDLAPALALAPFGKAAPGEAATPTTLAITLKGLIAAQPAELSTAFIAIGSEAAKPYRVGDTVSGASIQGITASRVLLSNGGRSEYLGFPQPAPPPGTQPTPAPTQAAASAPPASPPAPNPQAMLARLDASPVQGGYRIGQNAPPGLRTGDVIQSIDGTAAGNQAALAGAMAAAQSRGSVQVQIVRDGKPFTLTVPTR